MTAYYGTVNPSTYYPKSLVYILFPHSPPPPWFVEGLLPIALTSTICALVGFLTRISMVVSVVSLTFLAAFLYSWEPLWSHPYNCDLLAGLAFMFGRADDTLSIDSFVARHIFRRPVDTRRLVYWWPVILGQFAIAVFYFGGFYAKWSTPDFTYNLDWALSDNLRNSIALPWLIWGKPFPPSVRLLINTPWLWKLAGLGHLATQALPILSMFSLHRPFVRLAEGAVFMIGVALLGLVMGNFWNSPWMLLAAFFVDWEYFGAKLGLRFATTETASPQPRRRPLILLYAISFIAANLLIIVTRLDDRGWNRAYPFSSMTFYSSIQALKPYSKHLHDPFVYAELELVYPDGHERKWFCYPGTPGLNSLYLAAIRQDDAEKKLVEQIGAIQSVETRIRLFNTPLVGDCNGPIDIQTYSAIDLYASILDIPPYPEPARFDIGYRALVGRYERAGNRFIAAVADIRWAHGGVFDIRSQGLDVDHYEILLSNDPWKHYRTGPLLVVEGTWSGNSFNMDQHYYDSLPAGRYPVVVRVVEKSGHSYDFFGGQLYH